MDVVPPSPQALIPSSTGTTSLGASGPSTNRTWCFTPRNPLFFRRRAPRPRDPADLRRTGRGASLPASPYSFVAEHHVPRAQRAFGEPDVVPHSLQSLISSSGGTTSLGPSGPSAMRTWCLPPCKALFFHHRAPRPSGPAGLRRSGRGASLPAIPYSFVRGHHVSGASGPSTNRTWCFTPRKSLFFRPRAPRLLDTRSRCHAGRGASPPANPYSFVNGHHVSGVQRASGEPDVVLHSLQSLIPSSGGTTSTRSSRPSTSRTWCFTPRKPLFFRRRAPRPSGPAGLRRTGRGASLPASPYSFVSEHHVHGTQRASGGPDVVLHSPQALIPSSGGTTSTRSSGPPGPDAKD